MNPDPNDAQAEQAAPVPSRVVGVLTACADTMFRRGVRVTLAEDADLAWSGEATHFDEVFNGVASQNPDVMLLDAQLPGLAGMEGLAALRLRLPRTRFVLMMTEISLQPVRAAVEAGADCVLGKNASQADFVSAIKAVHHGTWVHPDAVVQALAVPQDFNESGVRLTPREQELLALMAMGLSNAEIATRLSIAMPTVKFHVGNVMTKLGAENRTAAVLVALRQQLVGLHGSEADRATTPPGHPQAAVNAGNNNGT